MIAAILSIGLMLGFGMGVYWLVCVQPRKRALVIDQYTFPQRLSETLAKTYPQLSRTQIEQVIVALREYFHVCLLAGDKPVSMPSQAVDVAWHELILFTRQYEQFCQNAFGRFLHHTPAEAMESTTVAQEGIKRAWRFACEREKISPDRPSRLPLLFALDAELGIADGFKYSLNCQTSNNDGFCASHIGCGSCSSCSSGGCGSGCGSD